jgi:hypothetical protein
VRDISFSTRRPDEIIQHIEKLLDANRPASLGSWFKTYETASSWYPSKILWRNPRLNKHIFNRITLKFTLTEKGPFSILRHIDRKIGRIYQTSVLASNVVRKWSFLYPMMKNWIASATHWHVVVLISAAGTNRYGQEIQWFWILRNYHPSWTA